ncbi:MAG: hypothetical protein U9O95_02375 [Candidatus Marinimicrobia bacterium]|nr:hypothetical protein [Candidatus Neomarinimicrobiota bacterium]
MVIIAALSIEIASLLNILSAKKIKAYSNKTALFHTNGYDLLITGVGPVLAERTLINYLEEHQPEYILNIGTAGMLNQELKLGEIYHIESTLTENEDEIKLHLLSGETGEICLSVRRSIEDSDLRDHTHKKHNARLADMECYALAKIAKERNIPMSAMKITTDFADCESTEMFKKQIEESAKKLAIEVLKIIKTK